MDRQVQFRSAGVVTPCSECRQTRRCTSGDRQWSVRLPAQAACPARPPDIHPWTWSQCDHQDLDPLMRIHTEPTLVHDGTHRA